MDQLPRRLGLIDASLIVIGVVIGSGIFLLPNVIARSLPSGAAMLAVWAQPRQTGIEREDGLGHQDNRTQHRAGLTVARNRNISAHVKGMPPDASCDDDGTFADP